MDEQLLQDLYGVGSEEHYSEDDTLIKEAQAELIEAVADEAGIDLAEMDDAELEKFASYVLSPEAAELEQYEQAEYAEESDPYAEADQMGRVMAHAYADEQMKIASAMEHESNYENALVKVAHSWDMLKVAKDETAFKDRTVGELGAAAGRRISKATGYRDIKKALELAKIERESMRAMSPEALKAYKGGLKEKTEAFKRLSANQRKAMMLAEIGDPLGKKVVAPATSPGLFRSGSPQINRSSDAIARRQAIKSLGIRGGGKAALTLGGLTAAGLGIKKLRER